MFINRPFWVGNPYLCGISGKVLGIDIDIRNHAIEAIRNSRLSEQIDLLEGSSTDLEIFTKVKLLAANFKRIMVVLDSNHTHEHVMNELNLYADLVSSDCFLLVLDTAIDDLNVDPERNWGPGRSPKSAVLDYMHAWSLSGRNGTLKIDLSTPIMRVLADLH